MIPASYTINVRITGYTSHYIKIARITWTFISWWDSTAVYSWDKDEARWHLHLFVPLHANEISLQKRGLNCVSYTIFLVKSPKKKKTIKNGRDQHFQESTLGGFSEVSVTLLSERGRGVYHEIIKVWKFRLGQVRWVRNNPTYISSIEDLTFISWCYNCQVLPSLNKVFTSLYRHMLLEQSGFQWTFLT